MEFPCFSLDWPHSIQASYSFKILNILEIFFITGVGSSNGVRASIHNGFWIWKLLILAFLCVTTFVIPVILHHIWASSLPNNPCTIPCVISGGYFLIPNHVAFDIPTTGQVQSEIINDVIIFLRLAQWHQQLSQKKCGYFFQPI